MNVDGFGKIGFTTDRDGNGEIYGTRAADGADPANLMVPGFDPEWQRVP